MLLFVYCESLALAARTCGDLRFSALAARYCATWSSLVNPGVEQHYMPLAGFWLSAASDGEAPFFTFSHGFSHVAFCLLA